MGVSHLIGPKDIPWERLKQALKLSETPQVWIVKSDKAKTDHINTLRRLPIKEASGSKAEHSIPLNCSSTCKVLLLRNMPSLLKLDNGRRQENKQFIPIIRFGF